MKNNLKIILIGLLVVATGIAFNLGFLCILGFAAILFGAIRLNLSEPVFKKVKTYGIISIPFSILSTVLIMTNSTGNHNITCVALGINVFFYIYISYYFTESLITHAKSVSELAATRSFRGIWTLSSIFSFVYFMATYFNVISIIITVVGIILVLSAIYYTTTLLKSSEVFFR